MNPKYEVTPEEITQLMGDFVRGGGPVVSAWLHGFEAGVKRGIALAGDAIGEVIEARVSVKENN